MLYQAYELAHAMVMPYRAMASYGQEVLRNPFNPISHTVAGKTMAAALDVFESTTRRYGKPEWNLEPIEVSKGVFAKIKPTIVLEKPFCNLVHFERQKSKIKDRKDPKVLIVAPMSGHFATLLRGTVEAMLPQHEVYVTDWIDARNVPVSHGKFDFHDFIDYIKQQIEFLGQDVHIIAVCQPGPPVLAATAVLAAENSPYQPSTLTLMGSPIDPSKSPTVPNQLATEKPIEWFEQNVIATVSWPNIGFMRRVYPGFLQLTGFMSMNFERHYSAHVQLFSNLIKGDDDTVEKHRDFYDEYLSVMDLTAEFYLQTIKKVFQERQLAKGNLVHRGKKVDLSTIKQTALLVVEGEKDDISGVGQTKAALDLCTNIPNNSKQYHLQDSVGHYGVFNGSRWRNNIQPVIHDFIRKHGKKIH